MPDKLTQSYIDRYDKLMKEGEFEDAQLLKREIELRGYTHVRRYKDGNYKGYSWEHTG